MISKSHSNRQAHNWLAYNKCDQFLQKYSYLYKGTLYDLGCGESPYREFFLQYAEEYVGVDWSGSYHDTKADLAADLNQALPLPSEIAGTVVSLSVLEHLSEPQMMLNEAYRVLIPGGAMILQVPWQWWIHEAPYDFFRYTPYGLKYMFEKAGFADVRVEPQAGFFSMLILKMNYFTRRFVRGPTLLRFVLRVVFTPFWYAGQALAPTLDRLDRNWAADATGYFVTAKKN